MGTPRPVLHPRYRDPATVLPHISQHLERCRAAAAYAREEILHSPAAPRYHLAATLEEHALLAEAVDACDAVLDSWTRDSALSDALRSQVVHGQNRIRKLRPALGTLKALLDERLPTAPDNPRGTLLLPDPLDHAFILENLDGLLDFADHNNTLLTMITEPAEPVPFSLVLCHHITQDILLGRARLAIFDRFLATAAADGLPPNVLPTIRKGIEGLREHYSGQQNLIDALKPHSFERQLALLAETLRKPGPNPAPKPTKNARPAKASGDDAYADTLTRVLSEMTGIEQPTPGNLFAHMMQSYETAILALEADLKALRGSKGLDRRAIRRRLAELAHQHASQTNFIATLETWLVLNALTPDQEKEAGALKTRLHALLDDIASTISTLTARLETAPEPPKPISENLPPDQLPGLILQLNRQLAAETENVEGAEDAAAKPNVIISLDQLLAIEEHIDYVGDVVEVLPVILRRWETLRLDSGQQNDLRIAKGLFDKLAAVHARQKAVIATLKTRSVEARAEAMNPRKVLNQLRSALGLETAGTEDSLH